jgi:hypothetical protein
MKIYYNENGWLCERYPYNIPKTDGCGVVDVSNEVYSLTLSAPMYHAWRLVGNQLVVERYEETPAREVYQAELKSLEQWFEMYDRQVQEYNRCVRLGLAYDAKYGSIEELDAKAVANAKRISEIRILLS